MKKKNTGLMLSDARGPLNNLLDNLSGEHADYWLEALKKLLRKEELPELPSGDVSFIKGLNSRQKVIKKINEWVNFLNTLPVVRKASACTDGDTDLINIDVYTHLAYFLQKDEQMDMALFSLRLNGLVDLLDDDNTEADEVFDQWKKDRYANIHDFSKALIELGEMYEKIVPALTK